VLAGDGGFECCEAPIGLPGFTLDVQWYQGVDQDSANCWLREQVAQACTQQQW
jgi:hypothetical protein